MLVFLQLSFPLVHSHLHHHTNVFTDMNVCADKTLQIKLIFLRDGAGYKFWK